MSKLITFLMLVILTGCYGNQFSQMRRDNADLQEQNRRLWARLEQGGAPSGDQPQTQAPSGVAVGGVRVSTGTMIARQQHGPYLGTVGEQPRQVTQGRKIQVTNLVCDDHARDGGLNCYDRDGNGEDDFNTWLSFSIDGQTATCDSGIFHPDLGVSMLPPQSTCFVELGANRKVKLRIQAYRNNGNPWTVLDLDPTPYATYYVTVRTGNGIQPLILEETHFD